MRTFSKPAIDVRAQLELLKHRGLNVQDEVHAESFLQSVSFFRLSPYMRPFQQPEDIDHRFRDGSQFRQLTRLYDFDRRLRLLTMDAIERVEIASRAVISNHMGARPWQSLVYRPTNVPSDVRSSAAAYDAVPQTIHSHA